MVCFLGSQRNSKSQIIFLHQSRQYIDSWAWDRIHLSNMPLSWICYFIDRVCIRLLRVYIHSRKKKKQLQSKIQLRKYFFSNIRISSDMIHCSYDEWSETISVVSLLIIVFGMFEIYLLAPSSAVGIIFKMNHSPEPRFDSIAYFSFLFRFFFIPPPFFCSICIFKSFCMFPR